MTGLEPPAIDLDRVLVVSPHLDDGVLSCGHLLAGAGAATVVTVFSGTPLRYPRPVSAWDTVCGFTDSDDIIAQRRIEDERAVAALSASATHLDFVDRQYRDDKRYDLDAIARELRRAVTEFEPTTIAVPLAIQHPDHRAALQAALRLRNGADARTWICYAEFPYVWRQEDLAVRRLGRLRRTYRVTPVLELPRAELAKAAALRAYASQLAGLDFGDSFDRIVAAPEQVWRLTDKPNLALRAYRWAGYRTGFLR